MEYRYHLQNRFHMVEFPYTDIGLRDIKEFRMNNPEFKHHKIHPVIQKYPLENPIGIINNKEYGTIIRNAINNNAY